MKHVRCIAHSQEKIKIRQVRRMLLKAGNQPARANEHADLPHHDKTLSRISPHRPTLRVGSRLVARPGSEAKAVGAAT